MDKTSLAWEYSSGEQYTHDDRPTSSNMRYFLLLTSWLGSFSSAAEICTRVQACSAQLSRFPQLEEVGYQVDGFRGANTFAQEASGWGSGMVPIYDELLDEQNPFDYSQAPEVDSFPLCECGGNQTCDSSIDQRNMNLDSTLRLTFCEDVDTQLRKECSGRRGVIRVIGPADESGKSVKEISSTIVFCSCPNGYQRKSVEVWSGGLLAIHYKCL